MTQPGTRWMATVLAALLVWTGLGVLPVEGVAQSMSKTIAVIEFTNDTGEAKYDNLKRGLSESLITKLAAYKELNVVERTRLDAALKEIGFSQSMHVDTASAAQLGKVLGANAIVVGSIVKAGSRFEINVRMVDVETSQVTVSEGVTFRSEENILDVVRYLSYRLPNALKIRVDPEEYARAKQAVELTGASANGGGGGDNSWMIWVGVGVGVVVIGGIIAAVALSRPNVSQKVTQDVTVGGNPPPPPPPPPPPDSPPPPPPPDSPPPPPPPPPRFVD